MTKANFANIECLSHGHCVVCMACETAEGCNCGPATISVERHTHTSGCFNTDLLCPYTHGQEIVTILEG